ncbi:MAG: cyanophycin synthetase [Bacillota bacterium]
MKINDIVLLSGRNIYCHKPVVRMILDIEELDNKTTKDVIGFNDTLISLFPTLEEHYCGLGYRGGFVQRLREGTYFGHVVEHLALELQSLLGYEVAYGKTRLKQEPSLYYIIFEYHHNTVAIECARKAVQIIERIINREAVDKDSILAHLHKRKNEYELGPSTRAIFDEAKKRGIPVMRLGNESILQLGYGKYSRTVQAALTDSTSCISVDIACNKQLTKEILEENNIPVPFGDIAYTVEDAMAIAQDIGFPVVLKPLNGNQGKGVVINLCCEDDIKEAFKIPLAYGSAVLVEKFISGRDYRVLVIGDKVAAVSERIPPFVIGDGCHTIKELIERENNNILRGEDHEKPLTKIKLDNIAMNYLKRNGLEESTIPEKKQIIRLRDNANLSTGGTARECIKEIHPDNASIAVKAAKAIGLDIAGIDIKADDIGNSIYESQGAVIEINAAPGLRMHLHPGEGNKTNVASDIIDLLFPSNTPHSIPIVAITGTNGKTTTTRLIKYTLAQMGKTVGMTSTSGIYIGDECILKGDNTGPFSAKVVLKNKKIDAAVLEVARGGMIKRGLGYDLADVGIITNISDDHIGLDDINSLEDLAFVKSLVIEAVKPEGYSVLNADDEMAEYFVKRARGNIILFSKDHKNPILGRHVKNGGKALFVRDNIIFVHNASQETPLIDSRDIPITFHGSLECNIENSLSAASALYALDIPLHAIKEGLMSFKPDIEMNPGRFNIFDMGYFKVMIDYGHNHGGYEAVGKFAQKLDVSRIIGIIGVPGDRTNESITKVGALCARIFSKIYIKEDRDLRGRKPGEVANLLYEGLRSNGFTPDHVSVILSETEALTAAMVEAQEGDMVIFFYEELEPALNLINQMKTEIQNSNLSNIVKFDNYYIKTPVSLLDNQAIEDNEKLSVESVKTLVEV